MKHILKTFALITLTLLGTHALFAQGMRSPQQMADMMTQRMEKAITGLSQTQKDSISAINLEFANARRALFQNSGGDMSSVRPKMMALRTEQGARFKTVLNDDQYKQYQKMQASMPNRMGGGRGN